MTNLLTHQLVQLLIGVAAALLVGWLLLVVALLLTRPDPRVLREAARLLPDLLRLTARLARDRTLPAGVRRRLGLLLVYLAIPIDLIPDVIPVLGYADDLIVILWTLHSVIRIAGEASVRRHWPGTERGCDTLLRLIRPRRQPRHNGDPDASTRPNPDRLIHHTDAAPEEAAGARSNRQGGANSG